MEKSYTEEHAHGGIYSRWGATHTVGRRGIHKPTYIRRNIHSEGRTHGGMYVDYDVR